MVQIQVIQPIQCLPRGREKAAQWQISTIGYKAASLCFKPWIDIDRWFALQIFHRSSILVSSHAQSQDQICETLYVHNAP